MERTITEKFDKDGKLIERIVVEKDCENPKEYIYCPVYPTYPTYPWWETYYTTCGTSDVTIPDNGTISCSTTSTGNHIVETTNGFNVTRKEFTKDWKEIKPI